MRIQKFIHAFLVLALVYAQLAAHVHGVSHFQPHECESFVSTVSDDCHVLHQHAQNHNHALDHSSTSNHSSAHHHESEHEDYLDCAIYHALLGLNGVPVTDSSLLSTPLHSSLNLPDTAAVFFNESTDEKRIRAPPDLS